MSRTVRLLGFLLQLVGLILISPLLILNLGFDYNSIDQSSNSEFAYDLTLDIFESDTVLNYLLFFYWFFLSLATNIVTFGFFRIIKQMDCSRICIFIIFHFFRARELKKAILLELIYFGITMVAFLLFVLSIFYIMIPLMFLALVFACY